jgi:hypothetical protein
MEEIVSLEHHDGSALPLVCSCNMANASNSKVDWTAEEIHRTMGCQKFRNYRHVSNGGEWVKGGEFHPSLGSFATIPKTKQGLLLDCTWYQYLNVVHMDIMFDDCLLVGSFVMPSFLSTGQHTISGRLGLRHFVGFNPCRNMVILQLSWLSCALLL